MLGISGSLGWLEPSMNGWPNSIQFLGISAICINKNEVSRWSWTFAAHFLSTTATQLHTHSSTPSTIPGPENGSATQGVQQGKKWRNDETTILSKCGYFLIEIRSRFLSKPINCLVIYCLHQHFYLAETRVSCPTGQLGVGSNMFEHVGESPKIPWFITMFPNFLHVHLGNIPHVQPPKIILSWLYTVIICYIYPIIHKHISSCPFYPHLKLVNTGFPVDCSF